MRNRQHPTRERLIEVVVELLATKSPEDITVDEVLSASGISKGSLYHHFVDFHDLIDVALAQRFAGYVDVGIEQIVDLIHSVKTEEEFWAGIDQVTRESQASENRANRANRLQILARATRSDSFRRLLSEQQVRLTNAYADLIREGQIRRWLSNQFDAQAAAVLIQAYTLGRAIDDITQPAVDPEKWIALINRLVRRTLGADELS
jgi:AcrR family transcriptional regulator